MLDEDCIARVKFKRLTNMTSLISNSTRAFAYLGQADSVTVLPGEQPSGENQSGSTGVDGTSHRGADDTINLSDTLLSTTLCFLASHWLKLKRLPLNLI